MKKTILLTLCALITVFATAQQRRVSIGIATNHITFACICGEEWQSNWIPSKLSVGIPLGSKFELTPSASFNTASYNYRKAHGFWNAAVDAKYNITTTKLQPFVMAGGSLSSINDGKGGQANVGITGGVGLNFWITDAVAVTLQENYHHMPDYKNTHYFQLAGGVTFRLPRKATRNEQTNEDGNTPANANAKNNTKPNEPIRAEVVNTHRRHDIDGDGILDKDDRCPQVSGVAANGGCPEARLEVMGELKRNLSVTSTFILFETASSTLGQDALAALDSVAAAMIAHPTALLKIEGHADAEGSIETNKAVTQRRADAVKVYLQAKGIDPNRLVAIGLGSDMPIADNNTEEGKKMNRRVELKLIENEKSNDASKKIDAAMSGLFGPIWPMLSTAILGVRG